MTHAPHLIRKTLNLFSSEPVGSGEVGCRLRAAVEGWRATAGGRGVQMGVPGDECAGLLRLSSPDTDGWRTKWMHLNLSNVADPQNEPLGVNPFVRGTQNRSVASSTSFVMLLVVRHSWLMGGRTIHKLYYTSKRVVGPGTEATKFQVRHGVTARGQEPVVCRFWTASEEVNTEKASSSA